MRGPQLEGKKLKTKTHIDFMLYKVQKTFCSKLFKKAKRRQIEPLQNWKQNLSRLVKTQ